MGEINWPLIESLKGKSHPNLPIRNSEALQFEAELPLGVGEVIQEARIAQHLLDMVGIPLGERPYAGDVDARTYLAVALIGDLRERLSRISRWHSRETGPASMVGDDCVSCGEKWPCDTRQMADGEESTDG